MKGCVEEINENIVIFTVIAVGSDKYAVEYGSAGGTIRWEHCLCVRGL